VTSFLTSYSGLIDGRRRPILRADIVHHSNQESFQGEPMTAEEQVETHSTLNKAILYATVVSGFIAAYLMYRRGDSVVSIARKTVTNPVGSLVSEVKNVV
jgi:hypothetical protein